MSTISLMTWTSGRSDSESAVRKILADAGDDNTDAGALECRIRGSGPWKLFHQGMGADRHCLYVIRELFNYKSIYNWPHPATELFIDTHYSFFTERLNRTRRSAITVEDIPPDYIITFVINSKVLYRLPQF